MLESAVEMNTSLQDTSFDIRFSNFYYIRWNSLENITSKRQKKKYLLYSVNMLYFNPIFLKV